MRIAIILCLIPISDLLYSQNDFAKQLNGIIKDTSNHFGKFRNAFKEMNATDSVFHSTITLKGTKENDVIVTQAMTLYRCKIIDSVNKSKGRTIVDNWYKELLGNLDGRFKSEKAIRASWSPVDYGWNFRNGNTWVEISLLPIGINSAKYWVCLAVTYVYEKS